MVTQLTVFGEGLRDLRQTLETGIGSLRADSSPDSSPDWTPLIAPLNRLAEVASRARSQEKEAGPSEAGTPLSDRQVDRVWDALHGIREALVKELPGAVGALASESSVGQLRNELKRMKVDLGFVRDLLKRFEAEKGGEASRPESGVAKEDVDLSGITITRNTLDQIYQLIENDERHIEFVNQKRAKTSPQNTEKKREPSGSEMG